MSEQIQEGGPIQPGENSNEPIDLDKAEAFAKRLAYGAWDIPTQAEAIMFMRDTAPALIAHARALDAEIETKLKTADYFLERLHGVVNAMTGIDGIPMYSPEEEIRIAATLRELVGVVEDVAGQIDDKSPIWTHLVAALGAYNNARAANGRPAHYLVPMKKSHGEEGA